ncbi:MAG: response regulator, partial [Saprospiraceae bacterium]|nr:response regulator [Saprospiraceae bacterium]
MGNQPIRTIIVDDESLARKRIRQVLEKTADFHILDECSSGEEALQKIHTHSPDLIFLDIELGDMDGFTLLENIHLPQTPFIVFITAHEHFAQKAFDVLAFDYLLKPFDESRLAKTLLRIKNEYRKDESSDMSQKINALFRYIQHIDDPEGIKGNEGIRFFPIKQSGKI